MHLHRFLWRHPEEEIREYTISQNMGQNYWLHSAARYEGVLQSCYVDDILTSHNSLEKLDIIRAGGFFLKSRVWLGQRSAEKALKSGS